MESQKELYEWISNSIAKQYEIREAQGIARIAMEDGLNFPWPPTQSAINNLDIEKAMAIVNRVITNEPIQYIVGKAYFYDLMLQVNPSVLIPRPETEELVHWILDTTNKPGNILDIGTGSGCIPLALKSQLPATRISGWDISSDAIETAKTNAKQLSLQVDFSLQDIFKTTPPTAFQYDIIVSNPPYIPREDANDMESNVLDYEPHLALFVKSNPLEFYEYIASFAKEALSRNGQLFFECHYSFASTVQSLLEKMGFKDVQLRKDLSGRARMVKGCL